MTTPDKGEKQHGPTRTLKVSESLGFDVFVSSDGEVFWWDQRDGPASVAAHIQFEKSGEQWHYLYAIGFGETIEAPDAWTAFLNAGVPISVATVLGWTFAGFLSEHSRIQNAVTNPIAGVYHMAYPTIPYATDPTVSHVTAAIDHFNSLPNCFK